MILACCADRGDWYSQSIRPSEYRGAESTPEIRPWKYPSWNAKPQTKTMLTHSMPGTWYRKRSTSTMTARPPRKTSTSASYRRCSHTLIGIRQTKTR